MSQSEKPRAKNRQLSDDLVGGIALLAIAALFLVRAGEGRLDWVYPRTLAYALAAGGVILVARGLLGMGAQIHVVPGFLRGESADVLGFVGLIAAYVVLVRPVGFWITSALTITVSAVYLDSERSWRRTLMASVVALAVTVGGFLLLTEVFYVPLPRAKWLPF